MVLPIDADILLAGTPQVPTPWLNVVLPAQPITQPISAFTFNY